MNTPWNVAIGTLLLASAACAVPFISGTRGSGDLVTVEQSVSGEQTLFDPSAAV